MADVMMPQLGETVTEGTITRWMKGVGDSVERDEPLFEVSTDKVDSEVPSPAAGVLSEILVPEGETVEVGVKLAVIGDGAATAPAQDAPTASAEPAPAAAPPPPPPARAPAPAPAPTPAPSAEPSAESNGDGPGLLSPMVRKLLAENGISESEVTGTGSGGRITRDDAQRAVDARRTAAPPPAPVAPAPPAAPPVQAAPASPVARTPQAPPVSMASFRAAGDQLVPFSNMRRRTAEHMMRSKATSPHAFIAKEVDFESVERVRKAWGERFKAEEGFALTYLPFVARAAVEALRDFPLLNASVVDDSLLVHAEVNLGIAVDIRQSSPTVTVVVQMGDAVNRVRDP